MNKTTLSLFMLVLGVVIGLAPSYFSNADKLAGDAVPRDATVKEQLLKNHPDALKVLNRETLTVSRIEADRPFEGAKSDLEEDIGELEAKSPDEVLLEILVNIRNEQKILREQIAESNRDIDELTFRVDTHSDSFRPLNTLNERPRAIEVPEDAPALELEGRLPSAP
ncbi:MAG: hypothetical protein ACPIA7_02070 [Akkermansiaceae bacterium]